MSHRGPYGDGGEADTARTGAMADAGCRYRSTSQHSSHHHVQDIYVLADSHTESTPLLAADRAQSASPVTVSPADDPKAKVDQHLRSIGLTRSERRSSLIVLGMFWFFSGVEYAVILPTIWSFLQALGMDHRWFLGLAISGISIASMISSPLFGLFADAGGTKRLLLAAGLFMVAGNFVYMIANDAYCVLESRFLCGLGSGVAAASFAYLTRISTREERTSIIGTVIMCRQLGMLVGPGFNFAFEGVSFHLGPFLIDSLTSPGAIMTVLWTASFFISVIWFKDIKRLPPAERSGGETQNDKDATTANGAAHVTANSRSASSRNRVWKPEGPDTGDRGGRNSRHRSCNGSHRNGGSSRNGGGGGGGDDDDNGVCKARANAWSGESGDEDGASGADGNETMEGGGESVPLLTQGSENTSTDGTYSSSKGGYNGTRASTSGRVGSGGGHRWKPPTRGSSVDGRGDDESWRHMTRAREYTQPHVVVLFLVQFLCIFNQVGLETWVTPFTQQYFGWHETNNSLMYITVGAVAIVSFAIVRFLTSRGLGDRWVMGMGIGFELLGLVLAITLLSIAKPHTKLALIAFIASCTSIVFGLPFLFIPSPAILSKLTREKHQGFGQGLRRTVASAATIFGPLWAGAMSEHVQAFLGLMIGMSLLAGCMFLYVFPRLDTHRYAYMDGRGPVPPTAAAASAADQTKRGQALGSDGGDMCVNGHRAKAEHGGQG